MEEIKKIELKIIKFFFYCYIDVYKDLYFCMMKVFVYKFVIKVLIR